VTVGLLLSVVNGAVYWYMYCIADAHARMHVIRDPMTIHVTLLTVNYTLYLPAAKPSGRIHSLVGYRNQVD
jgi:hypothetical protein